MTASDTILDTRFLRERRLVMGLSQRGLAKQIGVSSQVIKTLEEGRNHRELMISMLEDLAAALGVLLPDLFRVESTPESSGRVGAEADSWKLLALLHESGRIVTPGSIGRAFGWNHARVLRALDGARDDLAGTGLAIIKSNDGYLLRAAGSGISKQERSRFAQAQLDEDSLSLREAQILTLAINDKIDSSWEKRASNPERPFLYQLMNKELIEHDGERYAPHTDVLFSLGLSDA